MFSDPAVERLWQAGQIRAAYEASSLPGPATSDHPFRDPIARLDAARLAHEHGTLCWYAAKFAECRVALDRAHGERTTALGAEHPDTLDTLERLAALAHYTMAPDAPRQFGDVITKLERVHGAESVRVAIAERNAAACLRDRGKLEEARAMIDRSRTVLLRSLPIEHPEVVAVYKVSAMLHGSAGAHQAAHDDARLAVDLGTRVWGAEHPFVANADLSAARAEIRLGMLKPAVKRLKAAIPRIERGLGSHPMLAIALSVYAEYELAAASNFQHGEELARRAIAIYGETYPGRATLMLWLLFQLLFESGQLVEASELYLGLGDDTPRTLRMAMTGKIANHLVRLRDLRQALPWVERTRDLSDTPEVAAKWAAQAERLRQQIG